MSKVLQASGDGFQGDFGPAVTAGNGHVSHRSGGREQGSNRCEKVAMTAVPAMMARRWQDRFIRKIAVVAGALVLLPGCADSDQSTLGPGFTSSVVRANGVDLHYVRGGSGPAVILVHGFPEDWSEWRHVMPILAKRFTVVAVDLRGIGHSGAARNGFDELTLATDIRELARSLHLARPYIVGHDIGGMAAYAFARAFPREARGVMVLDVPLPGIDPWATVEREPMLWHFHFHEVPRLPEALVAGRQRIYIRDFVDRLGGNPRIFSDADIDRFARAYGTTEKLSAGFGYYRAFHADARWNAAQEAPVGIPIALAGGDRATAALTKIMAQALRAKGASNVTAEVIANSGHFVADEQPRAVAQLIMRHAAPS